MHRITKENIYFKVIKVLKNQICAIVIYVLLLTY